MLAAHVGRVWRRGALCRDGVVLRDLGIGEDAGWIRHAPGKPPGDVPSAAATRVMWTSSTAPLSDADVAAAHAALRDLGVERAYVWLSPLACNERVDTLLAQAGATLCADAAYPSLVRAATAMRVDRGREFVVRRIGKDEAAGVFARIAPWYGTDGIPAALQGIERGFAEFHAAFVGADEGAGDGDDGSMKPVSMGAIIPDGAFAYLGWMGTDPAFRGRGAQAALIAARVNRAVELGAAWCTSETSSVVATSLRNLERAGFVTGLVWRVYRWEVART